MLIHCPSCNTEYDCEPGKYECECGAKFSVTADGNLSVENSVKPSGQTVDLDLDKTIPPQRERVEPDAGATIPGRRDRKPDGRFEVGDLILGRYKVISELGQGGMGVVYKCFDEVAGIEIALKAIPPELSRNTIEMEDVKENFQLVSKLVHQNIAISKNLEKDNATGNYYLIMECIEGEDLRRWIKRKRRDNSLTVETILPIIRQVAAALDYAHEEKIIHRDIKPSNIMIDAEGRVKVLDFGLAAQIHTSMTRVSMAYHGTSGTAPYMAPEQWRGRAQGAAADQYALAVMTYEVLAGNLPFDSADVSVLREAVLNESAEPIPGILPQVQQALMRAMSKNPADRFHSCADFVAALGGEQVSEDKRKEEVVKDAAIQIPSYDSKLDKETAIKRISILMEQQDWNKARGYCEKVLDSDPENPELYLLLCLIEHKIKNEVSLTNANCDLFEDKNYSTAIKFASAERKKQLLDIREKVQLSLQQQYEFYIQKCLAHNRVSDVSLLSKCKKPLAEDIFYQLAIKSANTEQKHYLQQIQEEQNKNISSVKRFWRKTKGLRSGGLLGIMTGLLLSPMLGHSFLISVDKRYSIERDLDELVSAGLCLSIPIGYFLGLIIEALWSNFYKNKEKKVVIVWGILAGAVLGHIALMISVYFDEGLDSTLLDIIKETSVIGSIVFGIPFGLIWTAIWCRKMNNRKKKELKAIQDAQTEYILHKKKKDNNISKEDEQTLNLFLEQQRQEEKRIQRKKRIRKIALVSFGIIVLIGFMSVLSILLFRSIEFQKGVSDYKAKDYTKAAIHFRNAKKLGQFLDEKYQVFLGKCYYTGTGISKDYAEAFNLFWNNANSPVINATVSDAQFYLGKCFYHGYGCPKSDEQAAKWYRRAAECGLAEAQFELGLFYYDFKGYSAPGLPTVSVSYTYYENSNERRKKSEQEAILREAVTWFRKAAEQGHAEAQFYLGKCYENGEGTEKNLQEAVKWYQKAAEQGHVNAINRLKENFALLYNAQSGDAAAQYELGNCYSVGDGGVKQDDTEAVKWYRKAAEQGHADAQHDLAIYYIAGEGIEKNLDEGEKWLKKSAEQGNALAQYDLGNYYFAWATEKDYAEAMKWYQKAAEQKNDDDIASDAKNQLKKAELFFNADNGDATALYEIGNCFFNGSNDFSQDYTEAMEWFYKAAEQGHVDAQYLLGSSCEKEKDYTEAVKWYRKAAEQGHAEASNKLVISEKILNAQNGDVTAQYELGNCYNTGSGVEKNSAEAVYWYRKAAEQGHMDAQYLLGTYCEKSNSFDEAIKWYRKAAEQGHIKAKAAYDRVKPVDLSNGKTNVVTLILPGEIPLKMVKVEAGTINISTEGGKTATIEAYQTLSLKNDFYIGQTEVTQAQWKAVMGSNPSYYLGDNVPVANIDWLDAMRFCKNLNAMGKAPNGWTFSLPTDMQWEYAARGGKKTHGYKYSGSDRYGDVVNYGDPHPVGELKANEIGAYDMCGNVGEWCLNDWKGNDINQFAAEFTRDNYDDMFSFFRVIRGPAGNMTVLSEYLSRRSQANKTDKQNNVGFRLALVKIK